MSNKEEKIKQEQAPLEEKEAVKEEASKKEERAEKTSEKASKKKEKKDKKNEELLKAQEDLKAQKESYMRLAAEYDNYRKRTAAEKLNIYADATANAVTHLLPLADSMEMAVKSVQDAPEEFKKGLELVSQQLQAAFAKLNIESFGEIGDDFNPELHNAVSKIDSEEFEENKLSQVFQKGYKTGDKIIRHAMVQVANCD